MTSKEIKHFEKVHKGIEDGKFFNVSTGRLITAKGKVAQDKAKNTDLRLAAATGAELDEFIAKYNVWKKSLKAPTPQRRAPSPKPSPPPSPKPAPKRAALKIRKKAPVIRSGVPRVISPQKLPGYTNPDRCGPKNAYYCPDDKICNVQTNSCVKSMRGQKKIETLVNQLDQTIKVGGTKEALAKAVKSIKDEVAKSKKVVPSRPKTPSPKKTPSPRRKTPSPRKKTPTPTVRKVVTPKPLVPATPKPVTGDTMTQLVTTLSEIHKPAVSEATTRKKRAPRTGESPIPARPTLPDVQALGEKLNTQKMRHQIRQCLGLNV